MSSQPKQGKQQENPPAVRELKKEEQTSDNQFVAVDGEALQRLINFVAQAPLPLGRDALVQAVVESVQMVQKIGDEN